MTIKTTVAVKWFNTQKGFGFFTDERGDIFVHSTLMDRYVLTSEELREAGNRGLSAEISCSERPDGRRQATAIHSLGGKTIKGKSVKSAQIVRRKPMPKVTTLKAGDCAAGRVKWFNTTKGYGFLEVIDVANHTDMFVHISAVPDDLHDCLVEGEVFDFVVGESPQGLLANVQQPHEEMLAAE